MSSHKKIKNTNLSARLKTERKSVETKVYRKKMVL